MKSYPIYLLYTMCIFTVVTHARLTHTCRVPDTYNQGHTYDFTSLDFNYEYPAQHTGRETEEGYKYCVNPCGSCDTSRIPSCRRKATGDASIIKYNDDECIVMGLRYGDSTVTMMANNPAGVTMTFLNANCKMGGKVTTRLKLTCCTKSGCAGVVGVAKDNYKCDSTVTFSTPAACAPATPPPTPIPNPTNLVGAFYQGKCGLGQIGVTMFSKASKDPATLKEIQGIMETQSTNIQNSCEKTCEMTTPDEAKFTQNSQAPSMVRNLMDSTSNGGITPTSLPAIIPSKPCNCDVKLLSDVSIYCILISTNRKSKEKIRLTYISYIYSYNTS